MQNDINDLHHSHSFGQDKKRPGELRTFIVIGITATMMVVEITAGILFGSMALLADGLHMASHAAALSINAFAYVYARRNAHNPAFSFGTGKVNALGGFSGAILLAVFALLMAWESSSRLIDPVQIVFNQAILVAVIGLVVNGISVFILGVHSDDHDHADHSHNHGNEHDHQHDHNLKSAYLHVLTDALTSVLAILALLAAKYFGFVWMDPLMGIVGAILVARWSIGLLRSTSAILLDKQVSQTLQDKIKYHIESDGESQVADLHVWSIGPNIHAAIISVISQYALTSEDYKARLPEDLALEHVSIEVKNNDDPTA
ncbi:MAG: CDF family Co(II)/Ni(II) efflux transporter DmeF [Anaerolineaceae bacterium]|nr:CDF family Co(II)/Ni(II) efflux transporter DmeF [Anaerolineaceae bacterium]